MSEAATLTPEQELDLAKKAMYKGFITQLQFGGKATKEVTKKAGEGQEESYIVKREDFKEDEIKGTFGKYANEWLPHRQQATEGYYDAILGNGEQQEQAA